MNLIFTCLCDRTGKSIPMQQEDTMIDEEALRSIEKLHEMKAGGIISEEEFEETKRRLLSGGRAVKASPDREAVAPAAEQHLAWMFLPLKRYAQFHGRSSRREFWMFLLMTNVVALALAIIAMSDTNIFGQTGTIGNLAFALMALGFLGVLVPLVAVEVRRFHDQGKSGWFALLNLIPYIGALIVLGFMLVPGNEGENDFGPDPAV
jgi:uncharacterized membrane protein YhaH (DUF805 family)